MRTRKGLSGLDPRLLEDPVRCLRVWLAAHEMKQYHGATFFEVPEVQLSRIMKRRELPGPELSTRMADKTGGFVSFPVLDKAGKQLVQDNVQANQAPRARRGRASKVAA